LLFLRIVPVAHEDGVDGAVGHADGGAHAAVARCNFFQHQGEGEVVQTCAAQLFGHANAVGAERGQTFVHFVRESFFFVPLGGVGPNFLLSKIAHGVANHDLVGGEQHGCVRFKVKV
jgi:hypothetical protein